MHVFDNDPAKFKNLIEIAKNISFDKNDSYLISYPKFIEFFKLKNEISEGDLIIGMNFVYGWMPTTLELKKEKKGQTLDEMIKKTLGAVNSIKDKSGKDDIASDLLIIKTLINNSVIGASKLLHFIYPDRFPIWDRNIYRYFFDDEPYEYRVNDEKVYIQYLQACRENKGTIGEKVTEAINLKLKTSFGYEVKSLRAMEMTMFYSVKAKQNNKF
jgi:hypothetical protein